MMVLPSNQLDTTQIRDKGLAAVLERLGAQGRGKTEGDTPHHRQLNQTQLTNPAQFGVGHKGDHGF